MFLISTRPCISLVLLSCLYLSPYLLPLWASSSSQLTFTFSASTLSRPFQKSHTLFLKLCTLALPVCIASPYLSPAGSSLDP